MSWEAKEIQLQAPSLAWALYKALDIILLGFSDKMTIEYKSERGEGIIYIVIKGKRFLSK